MSQWLKQSTAVTIKFGPFVDSTDGSSAETGLTITQAEVRISKNGANIIQKNEATSLATDELGYYDCLLDGTDTNTLGTLKVMVHEAGALPVWQDFMVVTADAWDSMFGAIVIGQAGAQAALVANNLDHLALTATAGVDMTGEVADGTILSRMISNSDTSLFVPATHSLQIVGADVAAVHVHAGNADTKTAYLPSVTAGAAGGVFIAGTNAATTITTALTTTFTGNLTGSVASVTGAVGSVTGAVGSVTGAVGSVTGAVGSVTGAVGSVAAGGIAAASFAAGAVNAAAIADGAIDAATFAAGAINAAAIADAAIDNATFAADVGTTAYATNNIALAADKAIVERNLDHISADANGVIVAPASKTGYALTATGADLILKTATFSLALADAVWDELITGATHGTATSAGKRLLQLGAAAILSGTATAGTAQTITLDADAAATAHIYDENLIVITGGLGASQSRMIMEYTAARVVTVDEAWDVTPNATSEYQIIAFSGVLLAEHGTATAGAASTITLAASALAIANSYVGSAIYISAGVGAGQTRLITEYTVGKIATVSPAWETQPDNTSIYKVIPVGRAIVESFKAGAIDAAAIGTGAIDADAIAADAIGASELAADAANEIADALLDRANAIETGLTLRQAERIIAAACAGKVSGAGTVTVAIRNAVVDGTDRIVATVDASGNRTAISYDLT